MLDDIKAHMPIILITLVFYLERKKNKIMLIKNFRHLRGYLPIKIQNMLTKRDVDLEHTFDGKNMRFNNFWSLIFRRRFELND